MNSQDNPRRSAGFHRGEPRGELVDPSSGAWAGEAAGQVDFAGIVFEMDMLDGSIRESDLLSEYPLPSDRARALAAQGMAIVGMAAAVVSDREFESFLAQLAGPDNAQEKAFLFGFCEHVRQTILEAGGQEARALRSVLASRIGRAQALCLAD